MLPSKDGLDRNRAEAFKKGGKCDLSTHPGLGGGGLRACSHICFVLTFPVLMESDVYYDLLRLRFGNL